MITKNYKSIFSYLAALTTALFVVSCDQEDNTGVSTLVPTSPTLTVTKDSNATLIEDNSVFEFTATLSTAQLVDVKLFVTQIGGDATVGDDYTVDGSLVIPAGSLSAKGKLKILSDDLIEGTETLKLQIGDNRTANSTLTPVTMEYTILNYTDGDLVMDMSWAIASIATDNSGVEFSATDFADMRLLISTGPNNTDATDDFIADGAGFESFVLPASTPNGTYYVVADFFDANSAIPRDLNLDVEFNQAGVINQMGESFPNAINTANVCENNFYVLVKIVKLGNTYTITREGINNFENLTVTWAGTDAGFDSQVTTGLDCDGKVIAGLIAGWMLDFWGEIVVDAGTVYYTVDATGAVTIPNQFLYKTTYNGAVQPVYNVEGTGTYDAAAGTLDIKYSLIQNGVYLGEDYGEADGFFHATLTSN